MTNVPCARLAQSVERQTLNLVVVGSSPTLGARFFVLDSGTSTSDAVITGGGYMNECVNQ